MTRAFLLTAAGVALVQLVPKSSDATRFHGYYVAALAALLLFLSGMAFAARGLRFAPWAQILPAVGGAALVVFVAPRLFLPPTAELVVFLLGGLSFVAAAICLVLRHWWHSRLAATLVGAGGILGALEFLRAGLVRYAQYSQTLSMGISGIIAWAVELAAVFGVAGMLAFVGGAVARIVVPGHGVSRAQPAAQQ